MLHDHTVISSGVCAFQPLQDFFRFRNLKKPRGDFDDFRDFHDFPFQAVSSAHFTACLRSLFCASSKRRRGWV